MQPVSISSPRLWDFMFLIDEREASRVRCAGCRHCGGALHSATYARKPRGVPEAVVSGGSRPVLRHSFCCAVCRRRTTPASVRFMGRRVYVGLIVLLLPVLLGDASPTAVSAACRRLGVRPRTIESEIVEYLMERLLSSWPAGNWRSRWMPGRRDWWETSRTAAVSGGPRADPRRSMSMTSRTGSSARRCLTGSMTSLTISVG